MFSPFKGPSPINPFDRAVDPFVKYYTGTHQPSRVFDWANGDYTHRDVLEHSTSSLSTMVDRDGALKWAPHNLLRYSEQFDNGAWTKANTTITANAITAPDGTTTADKFETTSTFNEVRQDFANAGSQATIAAFFKEGSGPTDQTTIHFRDQTAGSNLVAAYLNLDTGEISYHTGSTGAYALEIGDGWWYFSVTATTTPGNAIRAGIGNGGWTVASGTYSYIWGAHAYRSDLGGMVNNPATGNSYVPTTSSAVYLPRIGHHVWNGSMWVNEGLLLESEERTNLFLNSDTPETQAVYATAQPYTVSFKSGVNGTEAIADTIAATAVDVFVYDTRNDSDGGAWRTGALAQASSWYNETLNTSTRGSRREFPQVAVIVAEAGKVTIYDGDDPSLPMWAVFNRDSANGGVVPDQASSYYAIGPYACTSIDAVDGKLIVGSRRAAGDIGIVKGVTVIDFAEDASQITMPTDGTYRRAGSLATRNEGKTYTKISGEVLVNGQVNDVATAVLDGDTEPTIFVFTDGGVSRIAADGSVTSTISDTVPEGGIFGDRVWATFISHDDTYFGSLPVADTLPTGGALNAPYYWRTGKTNTYDLFTDGINPSIAKDSIGLSTGLHRFSYNAVDNSASMLAITTSTYNTGWMPGDIKGAFLADTDDTDLVASGELVTNGTFDTDSDWSKGTGWTISGGVASFDTSVSGAGVEAALTQNITTVAGKLYIVKASFSSLANLSGSELLVRCAGMNLSAWETGSPNILTDGTYTFSFVATSTTTEVNIRASVFVEGDETGSVDNVSVRLADADRSVNNKGLIVNGTVTRSPVATGAELVGYSGFSASNYLEQPYNSDLDFGTGDFCVMGWVKQTSTSLEVLIDRYSASGHRIYCQTSTGLTQNMSFSISDGIATAVAQSPNNGMPLNVWTFVVFRRVSSKIEIWKDAQLAASASVGSVGSLSDPDAKLYVGITNDLTAYSNVSSIALLRISATAPTPDQIAKIYADELPLFQENAACTLYGASDAVTALAYDQQTELLHVGTSAGRSVFHGLQRVDNTTDAVGTAISAQNGFVVEE